MSPKDDGEAEDFVIVDNPIYVLPLRGGRNGSNTFNPPVETDYVTVDNENPADQDTPMAPAPDEGNPPMVQIEYFEPMLLAAFPEEMSRKVLMAPIPKNPAVWADVSRPSSPGDPQSLVVKNAILLLEAFFHFEGLHHEIGRVRVLYTAGRACELSSAGAITLQQLVGGTLDALRESRMAFLRRTRGRFVWRAEDENVRELARLVDRYISLKPEEPREVNEEWYALPALNDLWFQWQKILSNKSLRFTMDGRATGKESSFNRRHFS